MTQDDIRKEIRTIKMIKAFDPTEAEERLCALQQRVKTYIQNQNVNKSIAAILEKELYFFIL